MPSVYAIFGPTGSGKTEVAVELARQLGTEVVNCDPAQCYDGLHILTNKPGPEHDAIAPHRLVGIWHLTFEASVAAFSQAAHAAIDELIAANGTAVATGGSGLYLHAAISRLDFAGGDELGSERPPDPALREMLAARYDAEGAQALHRELATRDRLAAARIHPNDRKRLIRALEVALDGGTVAPLATSHWDAPRRHTTHLCGLAVNRSLVRERIDARTTAMFDRGVVDEVADLVGRHAEHLDERCSITAQRIHGISDIAGLLRGELNLAQTIDLLATRTRQYAKRQDTWARRWPGLTWAPLDLAMPRPADVATLLVARDRDTMVAPEMKGLTAR